LVSWEDKRRRGSFKNNFILRGALIKISVDQVEKKLIFYFSKSFPLKGEGGGLNETPKKFSLKIRVFLWL